MATAILTSEMDCVKDAEASKLVPGLAKGYLEIDDKSSARRGIILHSESSPRHLAELLAVELTNGAEWKVIDGITPRTTFAQLEALCNNGRKYVVAVQGCPGKPGTVLSMEQRPGYYHEGKQSFVPDWYVVDLDRL